MTSIGSHVVSRWLQHRARMQLYSRDTGSMECVAISDEAAEPQQAVSRENQATILSLPDLAWHLIFENLPERPLSLFDEPGARPGVAGSNGVDGAALSETCRELNNFYRTSFVSCLSLVRAASPEKVSRALERFPHARGLHLKEIVTLWEATSFRVDRRRARRIYELVVQNEDMKSSISRCTVAVFPCLRVLRLVKCRPIGDKDLAVLTRRLAGTLEELDLEGTELSEGDEGWSQFAKLRRLRKLNLSRWSCGPTPSAAIGAISSLKSLEEICIMGDNSMTEMLVSQFLPSLTRLRLLDFSCCKSLSPFWASVPASLRVFRADWTGALSDSCPKNSLLKLPHIVELSAGMSQLLTTWWPLSEAINTRLEVLDLSESFISDIGASAVLSQLTSLRKLILDQCNLVGDGVAVAASSLPKLERLNLCGTAVTIAGVEAIARGPSALSLSYIDCCCCDELDSKEAAIEVLLKGLRRAGAIVEVW